MMTFGDVVRTTFPYVFMLVACGGGGGRPQRTAPTTTTSAPREPAGPADMVMIRALLDRYSPTGSWIVRTYESIPLEFKFGLTTITLAKDTQGFETYIHDNAPDKVVHHTSVGVHEIYHGLSYRLQFQLQADANAKDAVKGKGHYTSGAPFFVPFTPTYPAREMDATFPRDARTTRYDEYINNTKQIKSTQQQGVYGILDEWTAYMHDARLTLDYWPYVRDEAPKTRDVYTQYRASAFEMAVPAAEFKLYILHYLIYARDKHPDVYRGLLASESFRRAFHATDDAWNAELARYGSLEPAMQAIAAERGAPNTTYGRDPAYPAVMKHLASAPYQQMLAELRGVR